MIADTPMERIVVVGSTGSGKSTLAAELARRIGVPYVELDALHWGADWTPVPRELFRERAAVALPPDGRWVVDGNYRVVRDVVWARADTLIWLDYPFPLVFWRLARRTLWRCVTGAELFSGNRERLWSQLFTNDSIFLWLFQSHWRHRREYTEIFAAGEYSHLRVKRLRRPKQTQVWFDSLRATTPT